MIACTVCKTISGEAERVEAGSGSLEVFLWLFFLIPGMLYTIWRSDHSWMACPTCHSRLVVPLSSPAGEAIRREFYGGLALPASEPREPHGGTKTPDAVRVIRIGFLIAALGALVIYFFVYVLLRS